MFNSKKEPEDYIFVDEWQITFFLFQISDRFPMIAIIWFSIEDNRSEGKRQREKQIKNKRLWLVCKQKRIIEENGDSIHERLIPDETTDVTVAAKDDGEAAKVEAGGDADASLGLRLNKLHDVHLSYPLSLMRQQLLKWLIHHEDAPTPYSDSLLYAVEFARALLHSDFPLWFSSRLINALIVTINTIECLIKHRSRWHSFDANVSRLLHINSARIENARVLCS